MGVSAGELTVFEAPRRRRAAVRDMRRRAGGRAAAWYSDYVKQSVTPDGLVAAYQSIANLDVTELLPLVRAPTLVIARMASEVLPVDVARNLTAAIPNARLVLLQGTGVSHPTSSRTS
jgi:pimeloyl-ACP methyl ester carboxylesterase